MEERDIFVDQYGVQIFHGGCHGCKTQLIHGIQTCRGCQYFDADWRLPNLFSDEELEDVQKFLLDGIYQKSCNLT